MEHDWVGLEITPGEIKGLTGVRSQQVYRPPVLKKIMQESLKTLITTALVLLSYLILVLIFPNNQQLLVMIHLVVVVGLGLEDSSKIILSLKHRNLIQIFEDVDRYNAIIKAIKINDELEAVGNYQIKLNHREQVIEALQLIRDDLVRAMKTERILRKNRKFLDQHDQLFATNLTTLAGLQMSDRATEHGRLLNEALQIAMDVQAELKQLQEQHSSR